MSHYCFAYPQTRHILGFNVMNWLQCSFSAINLYVLLSAGAPPPPWPRPPHRNKIKRKKKKTTIPNSWLLFVCVPLVMKSGNQEAGQTATRDSRGDAVGGVYLCQRLLMGILRLGLGLIGTRCVCVCVLHSGKWLRWETVRPPEPQ